MERLTKRVHGIGGFALISDHIDGKLTEHQVIDLLASRLADFEDLGKDPVEIRALAASYSALKAEAMPLLYAKQNDKLFIVPGVGELLYEADAEHGVVAHRVTDVHWVANTAAVAEDGCEWADYWTDDDIGNAFEKVSDAAKKVEELKDAVLQDDA